MTNLSSERSDSAAEALVKPLGVAMLREKIASGQFLPQKPSDFPFNENLLRHYLDGNLADQLALKVEEAILSGDVWATRFFANQIDSKIATGEIAEDSFMKLDEIIGFHG